MSHIRWLCSMRPGRDDLLGSGPAGSRQRCGGPIFCLGHCTPERRDLLMLVRADPADDCGRAWPVNLAVRLKRDWSSLGQFRQRVAGHERAVVVYISSVARPRKRASVLGQEMSMSTRWRDSHPGALWIGIAAGGLSNLALADASPRAEDSSSGAQAGEGPRSI